MLNNQLPEKRIDIFGELDVQEVFPTIQGEGPYSGQAAVFVRLAGCNLRCPLCDTDYTSKRARWQLKHLVDAILFCLPSTRLVVITGGEPFRQHIRKFMQMLFKHDIRIQIETNGTLHPYLPDPAEGEFTIVVSPKGSKVIEAYHPHIIAYKYVLHADWVDEEDGLPVRALEHPVRHRVVRPHENFDPRRVYVHPTDVKDPAENARHIKAAIESCIKHGYTFGLQVHKYIGLP